MAGAADPSSCETALPVTQPLFVVGFRPSVRNPLKDDMDTGNGGQPQRDALEPLDLQTDTVESVLRSVAQRALAQSPGDSASVTLMVGAKPKNFASTGDVASDLDQTQYQQGSGPCLDAVLAGAPMLITDTRTEDRWPKFTPVAVSRGVLSSLSTPIPVLDSVAASINVYATTPDAFTQPARDALAALIGHASAAIANIYLYDASRTLVEQMHTAAASRVVIDQARGILMHMHRCSAEEAFDILRRTSQHSNRKMRDIAQEIVDQVVDGPQP